MYSCIPIPRELLRQGPGLGMEKANTENVDPPQPPPAEPPSVPASMPTVPNTPMGLQVLVGIGLIGLVGGILYRGSR